MTSCPETPRLWAYVLGACDELERDVLDAHVLDCRGCLFQMLKLKRITEDGAAFEQRPAPGAHARLREVVARRRPRRLWLVVGAAAAAAIVFVLAVRASWAPAPLLPPPAAAGSGVVDLLPFDERT
jgi:anti-sigma factor RsiW